jgi:hypothetical protein
MEHHLALFFFLSSISTPERKLSYIRAAGQRMAPCIVFAGPRWIRVRALFILVLCITGYVFVWFPIDSFGRISDSFFGSCPSAQIGNALDYDESNNLH